MGPPCASQPVRRAADTCAGCVVGSFGERAGRSGSRPLPAQSLADGIQLRGRTRPSRAPVAAAMRTTMRSETSTPSPDFASRAVPEMMTPARPYRMATRLLKRQSGRFTLVPFGSDVLPPAAVDVPLTASAQGLLEARFIGGGDVGEREPAGLADLQSGTAVAAPRADHGVGRGGCGVVLRCTAGRGHSARHRSPARPRRWRCPARPGVQGSSRRSRRGPAGRAHARASSRTGRRSARSPLSSALT